MPFSYGTTIDGGESTANWTSDGAVTLTANNVVPVKQGTNCLHIEFTGSVPEWKSFALDAVTTFDLTDQVLSWWFFYVSGKGDQFLGANSNSIQVRVYDVAPASRGTVWAEWDLKGPQPDGDGHDSLNASWNFFYISGDNPTRVGGGGAPNYAAIRTIEFRFEVIDLNNSPGFGSDPLWFGIDFVKRGKNIVVTGGTAGTPLNFEDLFDWSNGDIANRVTDPDYGLIQKNDVLVTSIAGLEIGDGATTTHWADRNIIYFFDLFSDAVNLEYRVKNNALTHRLGTKSVGVDDTYAIEGCFLFAPETCRDGSSGASVIDFIIEGGASFNNVNEIYGGKLFRARNVLFGLAAGQPGSSEVIGWDCAEPLNVEIRDGGDFKDTLFHDSPNAGNIGSVFVLPNLWDNVRVFNNVKGFLFEDSFTKVGANPFKGSGQFGDMTIHATLRDTENVDFVGIAYDETKVERVV